jgi:hypothetical protein
MFLVLDKVSKVIIGIHSDVFLENGILYADEKKYGYVGNQFESVEFGGEIPQEVKNTPAAFLFKNGSIMPNPDYKPYKTEQQIIAELEEKIQVMQSALDELILGGM